MPGVNLVEYLLDKTFEILSHHSPPPNHHHLGLGFGGFHHSHSGFDANSTLAPPLLVSVLDSRPHARGAGERK